MTSPHTTVYHISDIHVGEPGVTVDELRKILDSIERRSKDAVCPLLVVTGDLTTEGLREEYEGFTEAFEGFSLPSIIVPGNHDERNYGSIIFEEMVGERYSQFENDTIALYAADSAEPDNDAGHVGRTLYEPIRDFFGSAKDKVKIFALHHHLVPVPYTGREHNVAEDAGALLGMLNASSCSIVLYGHRHVPWLWQLNGMALYSTGTLMSRRIRGAYSQVMSELLIADTELSIILHYRDGTSRTLADIPLHK
jgi:Icc protein